MYSFLEFKNYVEAHIKEHLPSCFIDSKVSTFEKVKNNGVVYTGLTVANANQRLAPIIYLEYYYEMYNESGDLTSTIDEICKSILANQVYQPGLEIADSFKDYDAIKDRIIMAVINKEKNQVLLSSIPYTPMEDLAIIYRVLLPNPEKNERGMGTITITNDHLNLWNVSKEEVHNRSVENSNRLLPALTRSMMEVLQDIEVEEFDLSEFNVPMYVVTNPLLLDGAAAIFYSNALEEVAEKLDSDLFILPSSIHETILIPSYEGSAEWLSYMVKDVNETHVDIKDQLADHAYFYNAKSKEITIAGSQNEVTLDRPYPHNNKHR